MRTRTAIHRHSLGGVTSRRRGIELGIECLLVVTAAAADGGGGDDDDDDDDDDDNDVTDVVCRFTVSVRRH